MKETMAVMDYQTQEGLAGCGFSMKFPEPKSA
jgi:hypothetical protein